MFHFQCSDSRMKETEMMRITRPTPRISVRQALLVAMATICFIVTARALPLPAGTPQPMVSKLEDWFGQISQMEATKKYIDSTHAAPYPGNAKALAALKATSKTDDLKVKVTGTMDGDVIQVEVRTLQGAIPKTVFLEQEPVVEGALVAIDNRTGQVRAMVEGFSFDRSKFNRATQARRQVVALVAELPHGIEHDAPKAVRDRAPAGEDVGDRRRRDAVLSRPGLGNDARLAHASRQHGLANHVVDLVRAGVVEVFALQINLDRKSVV